jgi:hypothetical protein
MMTINQLTFYFTIYFFLLTMSFMVYKIRHINDCTKIKAECATIVCFWLFIEGLQFVMFYAMRIQICGGGSISQAAIVLIFYYIVVFKYFVTMLITVYFQVKVNSELQLHQVIQTGGQEVAHSVMDFDMLLGSVYPHKQFNEYVRQVHPNMLPCLHLIRKVKVLRAL